MTTEGDALVYNCRVCSYNEKDTNGGMIMEINLQEKESESYKLLINEFTVDDPSNPHTNMIKCPNADCPSVKGAKESDVVYLKYDQVNLKYVYICTNCKTSWRSK
jgi:DNA-directed RNA polymerase subunit M/transcription elongation factor TFIIS